MPDLIAGETEELRLERVRVPLTRDEKLRLRLHAAKLGIPESRVLLEWIQLRLQALPPAAG